MKHYDSFESIKVDKSLLGDDIFAFEKLDGQNFCVKYSPKTTEFGPFGSRTQLVDETSDQFGNTVKFFKDSSIPETLREVVKKNSGKGGVFCGITEITFFFEWYGENSFAGRHQEGDEMHLALIDVFLKKKGYLDPKNFQEIFGDLSSLETARLIYKGKLTQDLIEKVVSGSFEGVKEGVVCKRSTLLKGQRLPKVKIKTTWWLEKLHELYSEEECKKLE